MADDADRADSRIENAVSDGLSEIRRRKPDLLAVGFCHYCGESVLPGHLFCDSRDNDCAQDWQHEQDMKRIAGR